jgi:hypothetical protein
MKSEALHTEGGTPVPFFERLKESTIGFSGYPRLARDRASGFGYLALLLLIVLALSAMTNTVKAKNDLSAVANQLAAGPDFGLRSGEVYYNGPMPARFGDEAGGAMVIIDTTGKTGPEALKGYSQGVLVTKNRLYQVQAGRTQFTDLAGLPISFTKADVVGLLRGLWFVVPIGYLFIYPFQLGFKALDAVILGLIALIWGSVTRRAVPFSLGFKVGLYAMSLPIIMQWVIPSYSTMPWNKPYGGLGFVAWWAVAIIYLIYGLQAHFRYQDQPGAFDDHP